MTYNYVMSRQEITVSFFSMDTGVSDFCIFLVYMVSEKDYTFSKIILGPLKGDNNFLGKGTVLSGHPVFIALCFTSLSHIPRCSQLFA